MRQDRLYPAVGLKKAGDNIKVNFGQSQFVFDIDSMVEVCVTHIPKRHTSG